MTTETEKGLSNVVAFPGRKEDLRDELAMRREEGGKIYCHHDSVWVDEKERTLRCRRCDALVDPFNYILHLCDTENRYVENVKYLRREEKQRRQNIENLIQIERNAKSRIRRAGHKGMLPLWQNERVDE
ncbi:hypothetical protein F1H35_23990 [Salmonella enterica]|uniref:Uncharacterized protein n=2 Tax=Salmonella enterica TaxID=28901 RepID=A0A5T3RHU7_SALER|nr:hypothetical protein [Salmonella enterica]EBQ0177624.1 hypothetical protein [Salmonella enterica subsp. enterica]EBQ4756572.1 hypothetical protein [Salmonella enterica subsp. diarizonae]EBW7279375.1 hypothetical protein [Salmonella enterica subsp. enterica serovar Typhimurium]ECI1501686.1 hypothetical protein [Salmonella enterica subsp. enterica serovar Kentucky]ECT7827032.1 hypothetical protein [Salmonella enterica subsp. enterica serovar 4,[5],12:i:-]EDT5584621.1 hypothetical protein [Sa